jgi:hypothetical protein
MMLALGASFTLFFHAKCLKDKRARTAALRCIYKEVRSWKKGIFIFLASSAYHSVCMQTRDVSTDAILLCTGTAISDITSISIQLKKIVFVFRNFFLDFSPFYILDCINSKHEN